MIFGQDKQREKLMHNTIAVMSDIHGNHLALNAVLNDIKSRNIKQIYNLGDSLYGPLNPLETYKMLAYNKNISSIKGNGDRILLSDISESDSITLRHNKKLLSSEHLLWIEQLPVIINKNGFLFCHGSPYDDEFYLLEEMNENGSMLRTIDEIDNFLKDVHEKVIFCGHTHIPRLVCTDGGKIIINPGRVGLPAYEDQLPIKHKMESGSPYARYVIIRPKDDGNDVIAEFICVPYFLEDAANLASSNGRSDWAKAIKTGRV